MTRRTEALEQRRSSEQAASAPALAGPGPASAAAAEATDSDPDWEAEEDEEAQERPRRGRRRLPSPDLGSAEPEEVKAALRRARNRSNQAASRQALGRAWAAGGGRGGQAPACTSCEVPTFMRMAAALHSDSKPYTIV